MSRRIAVLGTIAVLVLGPAAALAATPKDGKWSGTDGHSLGFTGSIKVSGHEKLKDLDFESICGARSGAGALPITLKKATPKVSRGKHGTLTTKFTVGLKFTVTSKPKTLPFKTTAVFTFTSATTAKAKVSFAGNSVCYGFSTTYTLHHR